MRAPLPPIPVRPRDFRRGGPLPLLAAWPLVALFAVPLAALLLRTSPALVAHSLGDGPTRQAIGLSLATSSAALILAVGFGTPLAWVLARRPFPGRALLDVLIDLPTVLPPAVAGLALLMAFGRRGIAGAWLQRLGVELPFTPYAVVLAQLFVAAPYYIKAAAVGLAAVGDDLHAAAALDGASGWQAFRLVTLPLAWRGVAGGAALCWSRALGEFGATILFAGNLPGRTQTMPLAVYVGFESGDLGRALTLAVILLAVSFGLLLAIRATLRREEK